MRSALVFTVCLFESPEPCLRVSWSVILITVLVTVLFFVVTVTKVMAVHRLRPATGREGLIEQEGWAESDIASEGKVFVCGEYWDAWSDEPIAAGARVTVEAVEGMRLKVRRIS